MYALVFFKALETRWIYVDTFLIYCIFSSPHLLFLSQHRNPGGSLPSMLPWNNSSKNNTVFCSFLSLNSVLCRGQGFGERTLCYCFSPPCPLREQRQGFPGWGIAVPQVKNLYVKVLTLNVWRKPAWCRAGWGGAGVKSYSVFPPAVLCIDCLFKEKRGA